MADETRDLPSLSTSDRMPTYEGSIAGSRLDKDDSSNSCTPSIASAGPAPKSWQDEEQILPKNNIPLVFFALLLTTFLAALDETIVATALPTITADLHGGKDYSWVGSAYLLATAALSPLYGKVSDLVGRKAVLYPIIVLFLIGSALSGAAQSMTWLIIARAIQGIGGGGILQMVNIIIGDIVPLEKRGTFGGYTGALWGIASIIGPLVGGALSDHASWRWCFWINLPTGGIALALLVFSLHFNPVQNDKSFRQHVAEFDFAGLILLLAGVVCLLLGFNQSETSWQSPATIALLAVGGVVLLIAALWECFTTRSPIIPPRLFKTRTTAIILITVFLHAFAFFAASFYLPVYYQALGASATLAGVKMLPFCLGACIASFIVGFLVNILGDVRKIMAVSFAVMTLGFGLMIMLSNTSSIAAQEIYPLISGVGFGGLFFPPIVAMQAAMPIKDMATSTATVGLLRQLGSTIGVSVGQVIWTSEIRRRLRGVEGLNIDLSGSGIADSVRQLKDIQPESLRNLVLRAYTKSIAVIWILDTPLLGVCFLLVLFMKHYSLKRKFVQSDEESRRAVTAEDEEGEEDEPDEPESSTTPPDHLEADLFIDSTRDHDHTLPQRPLPDDLRPRDGAPTAH
ncbi:MFS general substrate transporter [Phanerochaete sordida]|uniref:MFS general substrate transporter n=1 Tax=Phanerochaete sordida TaxID=48140 RepID=A0A9P3LIR4_9APHY|nr:MFS general substrate transporter [Phanerochaete sordida]